MNGKTIGLVIICSIFFLLFWFSTQISEVSQLQSDRILLRMELVTMRDIKEYTPQYEYYDKLLRKGAHFLLFMTLGGGTALLMRKDLLLALLIITSIAVFDEVHQSFVGRGASITDVLLDTGGGFLGWFMVEAVRFIFRKNHDK